MQGYSLETDVEWLSQKSDWSGLNAVGMVKSTVEEKGKITEETRFFITSLTDIDRFVDAVRGYWGVETSLYYCLDVIFGEDGNCTCKDNSAENFVVVCHIALIVLKKFVAPKMSLVRKRRKCQYDADFMADVLLSSIL
jgi:predicted transposase YbfD/YdcC